MSKYSNGKKTIWSSVIYLIKRKRHKLETCFNLAIIGCEMHVKIGQKLPKCIAEPKLIRNGDLFSDALQFTI